MEDEIISRAMDGGLLGVLSLFVGAVWKTLKRWMTVLEMQEKLMSSFVEHLKKEEDFLTKISTSTTEISENIDLIRQVVTPSESRSLIQMGDRDEPRRGRV